MVQYPQELKSMPTDLKTKPLDHTMKGAAQVFFSELLIVPTGLLTVALLTRKLGPGGFGLFALASTLVTWIEWSISAIFARAAVRFVSGTDDWRPVAASVVRWHLLLSGIAAALIMILSRQIASWLGEPKLAQYLILFSLDIPLFSLAQARRQVLIGLGAFRERAMLSASRWISRLVLVGLFVLLGFSVNGAILGTLGASVIEWILGRYFVRLPILMRSSLSLRQFSSFAVPLSLFGLSMRLFDKMDLFMLKALGGTAANAGTYGAAQNLSLLPGIFTLSFSPLLLSTLTRLLSTGDEASAKELVLEAIRIVLLLLPFAGMICGAAPELTTFVFGPNFLPAGPVLRWLIFSSIAVALISINAAILTASGKPLWSLSLTGPLIPLAFLGHLLLIPVYGGIGASMVTAAFAILGAVSTAAGVFKIWRVSPSFSTFLRCGFITGLAAAIALFWKTSGMLLVLKLSLISIGILGLLYLFNELRPKKIEMLQFALKRQT